MEQTAPAATMVDAYLARLGLEREVLEGAGPTVDALYDIHRRHVERVTYETTWIHLGERWGIGSDDAFERIATAGRGGYCFHLNGALSMLLGALGYHVTLHVGGVHGGVPDVGDLHNHLVLLVHDLPSAEHPDGTWYVDVGLGDALHEPLALREATVHQGPLTFRLDRTPDGVADWHLTHDPAGSFAGMSFRIEPTEIGEFESRHQFLSCSPDSPFARTVTAQLRDADGTTTLKGLQFTRREGADTVAHTRRVADREEWLGLLAGTFHIDLSGVPATTIEAMWRRALAAASATDQAATDQPATDHPATDQPVTRDPADHEGDPS